MYVSSNVAVKSVLQFSSIYNFFVTKYQNGSKEIIVL